MVVSNGRRARRFESLLPCKAHRRRDEVFVPKPLGSAILVLMRLCHTFRKSMTGRIVPAPTELGCYRFRRGLSLSTLTSGKANPTQARGPVWGFLCIASAVAGEG